MLNRLQRLLTPPIFEDEEKTRNSLLMMTFSWVAICMVILLILSRFLFLTDASITPILILAAIIPLLLFMQYIIKLGYVYAAALLVTVGLWGLLTSLAWNADGIRDVVIFAYIVLIIPTSFVLGWRFASVMGGASVVVIWYLAILENQGLRVPHFDHPINYARDLSSIIILICLLLFLLQTSWSRTLESARIELQERLRAEEKLQKQADYLTALHETAVGLLNRTDLNPLLESILARACELLETSHGLIEIVLADNSALRQENGQGIFSAYSGWLTYKGNGVTGYVWETGKSVLVNNYQEWEQAESEFIHLGFYAVMGIPLKLEDNVIGVLAIAYTEMDRSFTELQVNLMERFAALAALAIHNARLNEQTQTEIRERKLIETALRASEERFRKVFHASPIAICITTIEEGRLLDANNAYWTMTGYDPKTSLGQTSKTLGLWESPDLRQDFIDRITLQKAIYNPNYEFLTPQNEPRFAIALYELVQLNGQNCVLSMFYDITTQRQTEIALRESESRMSAIFSAIPDMIFEINKVGSLTGFIASSDIQPLVPPEDFLGHNIKELFPESISLQTMFAIERALATNQLHAFEYGMPPGEEVQFFEARVVAISSDTAIVMVRDISQRKWIETDRENLIRELEDKNAELERFTYTVSHDLKSPLITIKGFLGFLEQDAGKGDLTRFKSDVKRISDAAEKMQALLNELLELSRVGRLMNVFEYIPLEELAYEAVELVQGRIQSANITVTIQPEMPVIYGDRKRLMEVIQNIVDNAAKFTGSQPAPHIEIGHEGLMDGKPIFFIKDNGMGIEPEHLDRIFGLFNKLDTSSDGTGIGLTIVKRIIEIHNGRIWVQSEAGKGSTFFFTLQTGPAS